MHPHRRHFLGFLHAFVHVFGPRHTAPFDNGRKNPHQKHAGKFRRGPQPTECRCINRKTYPCYQGHAAWELVWCKKHRCNVCIRCGYPDR